MVDWNQHKANWPHLADKELLLPASGNLKVEMIIGNDQGYFHRSLEECYGPGAEDPVGRRTPLGWTATGPTRKATASETPNATSLVHTHRKQEDPPGGPSGGAAGASGSREITLSQLEKSGLGSATSGSKQEKVADELFQPLGRESRGPLVNAEARPTANDREAFASFLVLRTELLFRDRFLFVHKSDLLL